MTSLTCINKHLFIRHLFEKRSRSEAVTVLSSKSLKIFHHLWKPDVVHVEERAAFKGRIAEAEYRADVSVAGAPKDALL